MENITKCIYCLFAFCLDFRETNQSDDKIREKLGRLFKATFSKKSSATERMLSEVGRVNVINVATFHRHLLFYAGVCLELLS